MTAPVTLTWLGQSGFVLSTPQTAVLIDPFLSPHEQRALAPPEVTRLPPVIDMILATHGHGDHLDLPGIAALSTRARIGLVVVPVPHLPAARAALGGVTLCGVWVGQHLHRADVEVIAVPACHAVDVTDGYSEAIDGDGAAPHLGYVIKAPGITLFHAGDTVSSAAVIDAVRPHEPDVALLPINGRDDAREAMGIAGNLTAEEAVALARRIGARLMVAMHFDAVRGNTADPALARRAGAAASLDVCIPEHDTPFTLPRFSRI